MTNQKPQPGQYWQNRGGEIVLVAFDSRTVLKAESSYPLTIINQIGGSYTTTSEGKGACFDDEHWADLLEYLPDFLGFENAVKPSAAEPVADEIERDVFAIDNLDMRRETMASGGRISSAENQAMLDVIEIAKRAVKPQPAETPQESTWYQHTTPDVFLEKLTSGDVRYHRQEHDGWRTEDIPCSSWMQQQIDNGTWRPIPAAEALAKIGVTQQAESVVSAAVEDVGPVEWPKWYVPQDRSVIAAICKTCDVRANLYDGKGCDINLPMRVDTHHWLEVTESEALARITPQPATVPVEDLDEWVTQDRVPYRIGDEIHWSNWPEDKWHRVGSVIRTLKHGDKEKTSQETLSVRCRRRDLPPNPQPAEPAAKRIPVRLWAKDMHFGEEDDAPVRCTVNRAGLPGWREIHSDGNGGWFVETQGDCNA